MWQPCFTPRVGCTRAVLSPSARPQNQLSAAQEQHKSLALHHPSRSLRFPPHHPFGSGWHRLQQSHTGTFLGAGLDSQRVKKLASKLYVHSVTCVAKLVRIRRVISNAITNSHQESGAGFRSSLQPWNTFDPRLSIS
jgi:hypothetical protein